MTSSSGSAALGDYVSLQRGTTYKSALLDRPGPLLLGLASIARNGGFRRDGLRTYGGESPEKLLLRPGSLYVSLKDVTQSADLLGAVARVPRDVPLGRLTQDSVRLDVDGDALFLDYLYWLLRTPHYRSYCRARATGTTNLGLPRIDFLSYEVPPLTTDRKLLVQAYEALDSKLENNRCLAQALEEIAATLFKAHFVDFVDYHDLVDSDLGAIPRGWRVVTLGDVAMELRELWDPQAEPDRLVQHYSIPAFDAGRSPEPTAGAQLKSAKLRIDAECVLISKLNPHWQRVWWPRPSEGEFGICSPEFVVLRPRPGLSHAFLYAVARFHPRIREHILAYATGGRAPRAPSRQVRHRGASRSLPRAAGAQARRP